MENTKTFNKDYGASPIDLIWTVNFHPALDPIRCGFVRLEAREGDSSDLDDGQFSLRKIEEAVCAMVWIDFTLFATMKTPQNRSPGE